MGSVTGNTPYHADSVSYANKEGKVKVHRVRTQSLDVGDLVLFANLKRTVLDIHCDRTAGGNFYYVKLVTSSGKVTVARKQAGTSWNVIKGEK